MKYLHVLFGFVAIVVGSFFGGAWIATAFFRWTNPSLALAIFTALAFIVEMVIYVRWPYSIWERRRSWVPLIVFIILNIFIFIGALNEMLSHAGIPL